MINSQWTTHKQSQLITNKFHKTFTWKWLGILLFLIFLLLLFLIYEPWKMFYSIFLSSYHLFTCWQHYLNKICALTDFISFLTVIYSANYFGSSSVLKVMVNWQKEFRQLKAFWNFLQKYMQKCLQTDSWFKP